VIRIPGSAGAYGNYISLGMTVLSGVVGVTRFLCSRCGYSEEWVESPADIEKLRKKYGDSKGAG
jgi:hypothetical protein